MSTGLAELAPSDDDTQTMLGTANEHVQSPVDQLIVFSPPTNVAEVGGGPVVRTFHERVRAEQGGSERQNFVVATGRVAFRREVLPIHTV